MTGPRMRLENSNTDAIIERRYYGRIVSTQGYEYCKVFCAEVNRSFEVNNRYMKKRGSFVNITYRQFSYDSTNFVAFIA